MSDTEEKPPLFNRWRTWYALVMLVMAAQVVLYLIITYLFK